MEVREGYKNTEVGVIPEDWEVKKLSDLTSLMTNGFVGIATTHYTEFENGITYIQGYNVEENSFNVNGIKKVTKEFHKQHPKSCLQEGDLLTIQTGEVGLTTIVTKGLEGSNCHALIITRFEKHNSFPKFYSYYLNSASGKKQLKEIETGSTMKHINVGDMIHLKVPVPTKAEQTAIATALSDADALINSLSTLIAKKRNIKQGAMQELLQPKEGWEVKKLGEIFTFYSTANYSKAEMDSDGEIGCMHYGLIHAISNSIYSLEKGVKYYTKGNKTGYEIIKDGDVIMVDASEDFAGINKSIEVFGVGNRKFIAGLHTYLLRDENSILVNGFRGLVLNSNKIIQQFYCLAVGMKVYGVSKSQLKEVLILFPSQEEQTRIATILSDMDTEIQALETKLEKYRKIKQGMMQNLLTGKIRLV